MVAQRADPEPILPLREFLGRHTLHAIETLQAGSAAILKRPARPNPPQHTQLTPWRELTHSQVEELRRILSDPASYWNGMPIYRRFPPRPGFVIQIIAGDGEILLLADLQNPGWSLRCGDESYWGFHFAGEAMAHLAKVMFPEYASQNRRAVWSKGALDRLKPIAPCSSVEVARDACTTTSASIEDEREAGGRQEAYTLRLKVCRSLRTAEPGGRTELVCAAGRSEAASSARAGNRQRQNEPENRGGPPPPP